MEDAILPQFHCFRCIYTWTPRRIPVRMCPRCKSKLWQVPRIRPLKLGTGLGVREMIGPRRSEVVALLKEYGAKEVRVFGSVRRQEATSTSDVDLLVDNLPGKSLLDVAHLKNQLRRMLKHTVDIVEVDDLPWAIRPQVESEAVPL
jgi:predicted nucleotidyltransferase